MDKEGWSAPRGDVCGAKLLVCCFLRRAWDWGGLWAPLVKATARMIAQSKYIQAVADRGWQVSWAKIWWAQIGEMPAVETAQCSRLEEGADKAGFERIRCGVTFVGTSALTVTYFVFLRKIACYKPHK